jgi:hypothetical protein
LNSRIFIIGFLCLCRFLNAQENIFALKPALGITACQVHGDSYSGFNKLGFMGGLYVEAKLSQKTSADLGIIFIQKGARKNPNPDAIPYPDYSFYYLNLNYVEVPLVLRYSIKKVFITAGGSFAYLINYHEENELGDITGYAPFNKQEYSFNIGLGMKLGPKMDVEVRSNNSFMTIRPWKIKSNVFYPNWLARKFSNGLYNNILEIIVSYKINLKRRTTANEEA